MIFNKMKTTFIFIQGRQVLRMTGSRFMQKTERPVWSSFAGRFSDPRECLAAYLALETAEVLSRVKPANLLNIPNRSRACGQNLYNLWRQHGDALVRGGGLAALELVDRHDSLLLLIYDSQALSALLANKRVATILAKAGYRQPPDMASSLSDLKSRVLHDSFPHEIGIFLGYPLKDVVAFMGWARIPFTCQGPWKIYGNPDISLKLADACRQCRLRMARRLVSCSDPLVCLRNRGANIRSRHTC